MWHCDKGVVSCMVGLNRHVLGQTRKPCTRFGVLTKRWEGIFVRSVIVTFLLLFFSMLFFACGHDDVITDTQAKKIANKSPVDPYQPYPSENAIVPVDINFTWVCTDPDGNPLVYDMYLDGNLVVQGLTQPSYTTKLKPGTAYMWQIVAKDNAEGVTKGPVWKFTTNTPPVEPYSPQPKEKETVSTNVRLTWNCYDPDGDSLLYDVYINGSLVVSSISNQFYEAKEAKLKNGLTYEWFIVAKDNKGNETSSPKWVFNTDPLIYISDFATVQAGDYFSKKMVLSKGDKLQVAITSSNTINVWLVSELEFDSFVKNEDFNFFREGSSNQIINFNFDFVVPESGGYRLVLSNRFSVFTSKNVSVFVYWSHYN